MKRWIVTGGLVAALAAVPALAFAFISAAASSTGGPSGDAQSSSSSAPSGVGSSYRDEYWVPSSAMVRNLVAAGGFVVSCRWRRDCAHCPAAAGFSCPQSRCPWSSEIAWCTGIGVDAQGDQDGGMGA